MQRYSLFEGGASNSFFYNSIRVLLIQLKGEQKHSHSLILQILGLHVGWGKRVHYSLAK